MTLDGLNYTFNGLGEYTLIDVDSGFFKVQARTCRAKGAGTGTIFCVCAARGQNSSTVQVEMNEDGKTKPLMSSNVIWSDNVERFKSSKLEMRFV